MSMSKLFNGGRENWQTYLRTACNYVPALVQARMPVTMLDSTSSACTSGQSQEIILHPEDDSAINVLLGSFISFDIIGSASTRSTPILNINHLQVLGDLEISLESLIGCRNSVMGLILEISLLDKWKKEAQDAHKLSVVDLVKRGGHIQECLRQELSAIEDIPSAGPSLCNPSGIIRAPTHPEISKVFALSAVTYLHVVISGAYPELLEIAESVSETIVAFKSLKDPRLLRSVVWPFCISGCLAVEKQQYFFRDLVSRAGITPWATGTCFEAFQIMQECWKARIAASESCNWAATMKNRSHYVLLG